MKPRKLNSSVPKKSRRKPTHREYGQHIAIASYLRILENQGRLIFWHTPNGEVRGVLAAIRLQKMGCRAGVWDFIILAKSLDGALVFAEVKSATGKLQPTQNQFVLDVQKHATAHFFTWRNLDDCLRDLGAIGVA
jgi:hypothetical protein